MIVIWDYKVKFEIEVLVDFNVEVLVGIDDEIYGYVNDGMGFWGLKYVKYLIFLKKLGGMLVFLSLYSVKIKL